MTQWNLVTYGANGNIATRNEVASRGFKVRFGVEGRSAWKRAVRRASKWYPGRVDACPAKGWRMSYDVCARIWGRGQGQGLSQNKAGHSVIG